MATVKSKPLATDLVDAIADAVKESEMRKSKKAVDVIEVRRHPGKSIQLPEGWTIPQAIDVLQREHKLQEEFVALTEEFPCFPYDGANALQAVLEDMFGVVFATAIPSFFGSKPPLEITVEVGYKQTRRMRWGRFKIPGTEGENHLQTASGKDAEGRPTFVLTAVVQRKYEPIVRAIASRIRSYLAEHSIYKGQAFRMGFQTTDPMGMPQIKFLDLSRTRPEEMVFTAELEHLIEVNLWTPIRQWELVRELAIPLKRGVLLAGPYGTGKTLLAYVTAAIAIAAGWTFVYLENIADLPTAILWAKQFGRVVIFAEDLDQAEKDDGNALPNTLDGLDTKESEIMVVLTTNHIDQVNQILLRPGRLDCILPIDPPDADAHERLIRVYGAGMLAEGESFTEVGQLLADQQVIPAVTREVVERAKLAFVNRAPDKAMAGEIDLTADDLFWSAKTLQAQAKLLAPKGEHVPTAAEAFGKAMGDEVGAAMEKVSTKIAGRVAIAAAGEVRDLYR